MSLHYQSTSGLQGVVKTNKGIEIRNARLNIKNATPGLGFNGSDELVNEWYDKQAGSDVDMGSNKITNLTDPTSAQDAVTINYLESGSISNDLDMNSNKIKNLGAPANPQDATSKNYVDSLAGTPALKDSLRAYYSFDGDYKDSTTNNYDAVSTNGTSFSSGTAVINQSLDVTGGFTEYVEVPTGVFDWKDGDFSISMWIYPTSSSSDTSVISSYTSGGGGKASVLQYRSSELFRFFTSDTNGNNATITTNQSCGTGQWWFITITRTGGTGKIYVNGQLDKSGTVKSADISGSETVIGNLEPEIDDGVQAYIDEVGVWFRVLSPQEILHLYNNGAGNQYLSTMDWYAIKQSNHVDMNGYRVSNLGEALQSGDAVDKAYVDSRAPMAQLYQGAQAYYTFDGDYTDSINGYDGTNNGASLVSGKLGQGADFGISGTANVSIGDALDWGSSDFSISCWVYPVDKSSIYILISTYDNSSNTCILQYLTSGKFELFTRDGNSSTNTTSNNSYPPNMWHYVVATRTGSTAKLYVNGVLDITGSSQPGDISANPTNGTLGARDPTGIKSLNGVLDETGIWNRVLTENEIKYLYHEGTGTNDFVSYDYTMNYDVDMNQNQILNLGSAQTTTLTIADDSAKSITPANKRGVLFIEDDIGIAQILYDVANGSIQKGTQLGLITTATGNYTGTDGVDGQLTVSADGTNGQIDVENRTGSQTTVRILNIF